MISLRALLLGSLLLSAPLAGRCAVRVKHILPARLGHMTAQAEGGLTVNFVPLPQGSQILAADGVGVMNLGKVSYAGNASQGVQIQRHARNFDVATEVGILVGKQGMIGQSVTLKAWLAAPVDPYSVYLGDVQLGRNPVSVDARLPLGVLTPYQLRVRVPVNAPERKAGLQTVISMQVIQN